MYVKAPKPALAGFEAGEADSAKSSSIFFEHNFFEGYFLFSEFDWKDAEKPFFQKEKRNSVMNIKGPTQNFQGPSDQTNLAWLNLKFPVKFSIKALCEKQILFV
jgi:hypothetical protein